MRGILSTFRCRTIFIEEYTLQQKRGLLLAVLLFFCWHQTGVSFFFSSPSLLSRKSRYLRTEGETAVTHMCLYESGLETNIGKGINTLYPPHAKPSRESIFVSSGEREKEPKCQIGFRGDKKVPPSALGPCFGPFLPSFSPIAFFSYTDFYTAPRSYSIARVSPFFATGFLTCGQKKKAKK